jgi:glycosyltransferase involved in cell wall biosynthesis
MKIAFVSAGTVIYDDFRNETKLGGTEHQVLGICKELVKRGHEVHLLRRWYEGPGEEQIDGINIININSPDLPDNLVEKVPTKILYSILAANRVKALRPDVLNMTGKSSSYGLCKLAIPKIHAALFNLGGIRSERFSLRAMVEKRFELRILKYADAVVVRNQDSKDYLEKQGFRAVIIPVGVGANKYSPEYSGGEYILYGGRLAPEKGVHLLIKAYSMLARKAQAKFELVICGSGPLESELKDLASSCGIQDKVTFISWLPNPEFIKKLAESAIFVMPSVYEGMPMALLEAMASGKPVIASAVPGPQDIITHGKDGYLFQKGNIAQLKEFLELLIENSELREETGRKARETVEEKYTFEKVASMYLHLYEEIAK